MAEDPPPSVGTDQVAEIVANYVRHHQIRPDQLAGLIVEVHRALANPGRGTPVHEPPQPAVPIRRSVQRHYVVCLECGLRAQTLRRHLRASHGLEIADYRARWKLSAAYPLVAPSYSARRAAFAKEIGLGRSAAAEPTPPATERRGARRRGRSAKAHASDLTTRNLGRAGSQRRRYRSVPPR